MAFMELPLDAILTPNGGQWATGPNKLSSSVSSGRRAIWGGALTLCSSPFLRGPPPATQTPDRSLQGMLPPAMRNGLGLLLVVTSCVPVFAVTAQQNSATNNGCTYASAPTGVNFTFEFVRPTASIRDDGKGAYSDGVDGVQSPLQNAGARLYPFVPAAETVRRTLVSDLSHPADAKAQQDFGIVQRPDSNFRVFWKQDNTAKIIYGILDIPVGMTVQSERVELSVMLEGRQHILRFGDMDESVCWQARIGPNGKGTTRATVTRASESEWRLDLPAGSLGRLWDLKGRQTETTSLFRLPAVPLQNAAPTVDEGLYYSDTAVVIRRR